MNYCFIFCHGLGFDHRFLEPLISKYFSKTSYYCLDLGYFGKENLSLPKQNDSTFVGIGHSLGFIKLASLNIKFKAFIGIQAFINFLGFDLQLRQKRGLELNAMIQHFQIDPIKTLMSFYRKCGLNLTNYDFLDLLDKKKLIQDLELLTLMYKLPNVPLLILGAANDIIVPSELIYDNFSNDVKIVIHNKGHHSLGLCECDFVYEEIVGFLNGITKNAYTE